MEQNTPEMQAAAVEALRGEIDMAQAMSRINDIEIPIFVAGRDRDHNQSTFRLSYELMKEAGKPAEWQSYDHEHHGFIFIQRNADGQYVPDVFQEAAVADSIAFFDRYLKP